MKSIVRMVKNLDGLMTKYPLYSSMGFWLLTSIITFSLIVNSARKLLSLRVPLWITLLVGITIYLGLFILYRMTKGGWSRILDRPKIALLAFIISVVTFGVVLVLAEDENRLVIEIEHLRFPYITAEAQADFDSEMMFAKAFYELHNAYNAYPDLFIENAGDILSEIKQDNKKMINEIVSRLLMEPKGRIDLLLHNRTGQELMVYKATGKIKIGAPVKVLGGELLMSKTNELIQFSPDYIKDVKELSLDFVLPSDRTLLSGEAGRNFILLFDLNSLIEDRQLIEEALAFQLRKEDLFGKVSDEYSYYLAAIYESFLNEQFGLVRKAYGSPEDFVGVGLHLEITLYHTFGSETLAENLVFGVMPHHEIDEQFWPYGLLDSGVDVYKVYGKDGGIQFRLQRGERLD